MLKILNILLLPLTTTFRLWEELDFSLSLLGPRAHSLILFLIMRRVSFLLFHKAWNMYYKDITLSYVLVFLASFLLFYHLPLEWVYTGETPYPRIVISGSLHRWVYELRHLNKCFDTRSVHPLYLLAGQTVHLSFLDFYSDWCLSWWLNIGGQMILVTPDCSCDLTPVVEGLYHGSSVDGTHPFLVKVVGEEEYNE